MKLVTVRATWTLVTNTVALLQFHRPCRMYIGGDTEPSDNLGFTMGIGEKYVHNTVDNVWAKDISHLTDTSVTVCEIS